MASEIKQLLDEAQTKACQVTDIIKKIPEFSPLIEAINFDMVQAAIRLVSVKDYPEMLSLDGFLFDAIKKAPPSEQQYQVARKIEEAFTFVGLPSGQKGGELTPDGFTTGEFNNQQPSLKVGKRFSIERFNKAGSYPTQVEIVITGTGDLLLVSGNLDTRPLTASEILSHGQEILEAIQPSRLESLHSLVQEAKKLQWINYLPNKVSR